MIALGLGSSKKSEECAWLWPNVAPIAAAVRSLFIPKEKPMMSRPAHIPMAMELNTMMERIRERQMLRQATLKIMNAYFLSGSTS